MSSGEYNRVRNLLEPKDRGKGVDYEVGVRMELVSQAAEDRFLRSLLLSVLNSERQNDHCLPTNVFDLYRMGVKSLIRSFANLVKPTSAETWETQVYILLQDIAHAMQDKGRSILTQEDLDKRPAGDRELWENLCGIKSQREEKTLMMEAEPTLSTCLSLIKVISQKLEYRFANSSVQEFLFLEHLRSIHRRPNVSEFLQDWWYDNVCKIAFGNRDLVQWLVPEQEFCADEWNPRQLKLVADLFKIVTLKWDKTVNPKVQFSDVLHLVKELSVSSLNISKNPLESEDVKSLASTLRDNRSLRALDLSQTRLGPECCATVLLEARHIKQLQLASNGIGDALSGLLQLRALVVLDLYDNGLSDQGAEILTQLLRPQGQLRWLDLSKNLIRTRGVLALCSALKQNSSLSFVGLNQNPIDIMGIQGFVEMLGVNCTLTHWHLSSTSVPQEQVAATLEAVLFKEHFSGSWKRELRPHTEAVTFKVSSPRAGPQQHPEKKEQPSKGTFARIIHTLRNPAKDTKTERKTPMPRNEISDSKETEQKSNVNESICFVLGPKESVSGFFAEAQEQSYFHVPEELRKQESERIVKNVMPCMLALLDAVSHYGGEIIAKASESVVREGVLTEESSAHVATLWRDPGVQKAVVAFERGFFPLKNVPNTYYLSIILGKAQEIARAGYLASPEEVTAVRESFMGVREFYAKGERVKFVDGAYAPKLLSENEKTPMLICAVDCHAESDKKEIKQFLDKNFRDRELPPIIFFSASTMPTETPKPSSTLPRASAVSTLDELFSDLDKFKTGEKLL